MDFFAAKGSTDLILPSSKAERIKRATFTELCVSSLQRSHKETFVIGERFTYASTA